MAKAETVREYLQQRLEEEYKFNNLTLPEGTVENILLGIAEAYEVGDLYLDLKDYLEHRINVQMECALNTL